MKMVNWHLFEYDSPLLGTVSRAALAPSIRHALGPHTPVGLLLKFCLIEIKQKLCELKRSTVLARALLSFNFV